ncbi:MAG: hypothetical protein C0623_10060 [Desulfuromonas sp.]|nr:MAG: hypothetical protein C0623_10060 [Desulfuromonas sp.]
MKEQVKKISILTVAIAVGLAVTVSSSFACWGNGMGHMTNSTHALTVEQQQKLDTVKEKYSTELDALQSSLNKKSDAYSKALTNESTTVGTLNRLDAERVDLERQYFALLDQANKEAGLYVSGNSGPWFGCNYRGCNHQNHMGSHTYGRHMRQNNQHGMHENHMTRCW